MLTYLQNPVVAGGGDGAKPTNCYMSKIPFTPTTCTKELLTATLINTSKSGGGVGGGYETSCITIGFQQLHGNRQLRRQDCIIIGRDDVN